MNTINKISLIYNNTNKLFGKKFIKNNINNCTMIIDRKEYKLYVF